MLRLTEWFQNKNEREGVEPSSLMDAFDSISEYLTFRSEQLGKLIELFDGNYLLILTFRSHLEDRSVH